MSVIGICARCGRIRQIYDRRNEICFCCYENMSPYAKPERRPRNENHDLSGSSHFFDIRI